jgi:hypothetical protein
VHGSPRGDLETGDSPDIVERLLVTVDAPAPAIRTPYRRSPLDGASPFRTINHALGMED